MIRMIRLYFKGGEFDPLLGNHIEFEDREFFRQIFLPYGKVFCSLRKKFLYGTKKNAKDILPKNVQSLCPLTLDLRPRQVPTLHFKTVSKQK